MAMTCEIGKCLVCGTEIARKCEGCNSAWKNLGNYTTVEIPWSNGSKMSTAVCMVCSVGPVWKADKMDMTKAIWAAWDRQGVGRYDKAVVIV